MALLYGVNFWIIRGIPERKKSFYRLTFWMKMLRVWKERHTHTHTKVRNIQSSFHFSTQIQCVRLAKMPPSGQFTYRVKTRCRVRLTLEPLLGNVEIQSWCWTDMRTSQTSASKTKHIGTVLMFDRKNAKRVWSPSAQWTTLSWLTRSIHTLKSSLFKCFWCKCFVQRRFEFWSGFYSRMDSIKLNVELSPSSWIRLSWRCNNKNYLEIIFSFKLIFTFTHLILFNRSLIN